jgi:hypothetical protein
VIFIQEYIRDSHGMAKCCVGQSSSNLSLLNERDGKQRQMTFAKLSATCEVVRRSNDEMTNYVPLVFHHLVLAFLLLLSHEQNEVRQMEMSEQIVRNERTKQQECDLNEDRR